MSKNYASLKTEVFEVRDSEFSIECLTDMVNDYIKEERIAREDIQEYRTEHWVDKAEDGTDMYNFRAILTFWNESLSECECNCDCETPCENCTCEDSATDEVG